jgi:hypothetical protein
MRDAASPRPAAPPRAGLASRDVPPPVEATVMRPAASPRDGLGLRDTLSSRDPLAALARASAPARDAFPMLDVSPPRSRETRAKGELISNARPRTLLDDAADLGMAPAPPTDTASRWEQAVSSAAPAAGPAGDTAWKRKKRSSDFEGDAALKELRTRLAAAPAVDPDQAPEPPLAPPKTPMLASAVRLMGVVGLAATGALGFLWLTSHGRPGNSLSGEYSAIESTVVDNSPAPAGRFDRSAQTLRTVETPDTDTQWAPVNYPSSTTEKTLQPPVVQQPRTSGPPPRVPAVQPQVAMPRSTPPVQPVAAPSPPPAPAPAPAPAVLTAPAPAAAPVAAAPRLNREEIDSMLTRARNYLSSGEVAAARLVLKRAAASEDPQAALALGGTYDPSVLSKLGIIGPHADPAEARKWYTLAASLGSADASLRLDQLQTGR